jgi:RNA polymerase sigma-70 factor (ECF subfamily)
MSVTVPEAQERPDAELIEAWRRGEESAAAELVRRHTRALARFLAAAGAREDLDDLVQETFFRAFRRIGSYRGTATFRTWLMAIGSNALKDLRRRGKQRTVLSIEDRDVADSSADPHDRAVEGELLDRLEEAVAQLPAMQRDVFLMRAQQGAEYREIATALETSMGAARVHYHQAVKRLKAALKWTGETT